MGWLPSYFNSKYKIQNLDLSLKPPQVSQRSWLPSDSAHLDSSALLQVQLDKDHIFFVKLIHKILINQSIEIAFVFTGQSML